jgi:hypothetical protein
VLKICLYYKKKIQVFFNIGKISMVKKKGHSIFFVNSISDLNNVIILHFINMKKKIDFFFIIKLMKAKKQNISLIKKIIFIKY